MNRLVAWVLGVAFLTSANLQPAVADDPVVTPEDGAFISEFQTDIRGLRGDSDDNEGAGVGVSTVSPPLCTEANAGPDCRPATVCVPDSTSPTGGLIWSGTQDIRAILGTCTPSDGEPGTAAVLTPARVLQAFRRIPLPASVLVVQPPGGRTLVNFDTLFRTEAGPFTRTVSLLGRRVELEIRPSSFTWVHGDGTAQTTTTPGVAYARGRATGEYVSHRYTDAGVAVAPRVDTTYAARFRVDGGRWREVAGTVTIQGAPGRLRVVEARPVLTGTS